MVIGGRKFEGYTYVLAIINLTPDSFYEKSRVGLDGVLYAVERAIKEGAAVIDLGVQSTRPGYEEVSADEEIARLSQPLELIKSHFDIPVSVDTYFAKTARAALELKADMINDIWGLWHDEGMAGVVASNDASLCIMHNSLKPTVSLWEEMDSFLNKSLERAASVGIDSKKICLDGGIGFAKSLEQNWELLRNYERLSKYGYPLLLGASRKSLFGGRVEDRLEATLKSTEDAARKGVLFVRVHDIKENVEAIKRVYGG